MLGEELSRALSDISDDKIEAAADIVPTSRKHIWLRLAAVAAVLALVVTWLLWPGETDDGVITAQGILKVYAYDVTTGAEVKNRVGNELPDGVVYQPSIWFLGMSSRRGLPFTFEIDDDYFAGNTITFDISVNYGHFWHYNKEIENYENLGQAFSIGNKEKIYWNGAFLAEAKEIIKEEGGIYADVVIRADGIIAGYAMVEIGCSEEPTALFFPVRCETVCFPMIDGEFQPVSEEYVAQQILECKATESLYSGEEKLAEYHAYIRKIFEDEGTK